MSISENCRSPNGACGRLLDCAAGYIWPPTGANGSNRRGVLGRMTGFAIGRRLAGQWARTWSLAAVFAVGVSSGGAQAMAEAQRQLTYDVKHSVFGEIGTYTNTIEQAGAVTTIKTAAHFLVK